MNSQVCVCPPYGFISPIEAVFSSKDWGEMACPGGEDAQTFTDVTDEALHRLALPLKIQKN